MATYRSGKQDDKKAQKRLILSILGSLIVLGLLATFGLKALISFSVLMDKVRGNTPIQKTKTVILPPTLESDYEATNSATIAISATGKAGLTLIVYFNEEENKRQVMPTEGTLALILPAKDGTNIVSAKLTDNKGNISDLSNILRITVKKTAPKLDITSPADNSTVTGEKNITNIKGTTDEDTTVKVNDRLVVVASDGSFNFPYQLSEGSNTLTIVASDSSGNQTTVLRHVTYQK